MPTYIGFSTLGANQPRTANTQLENNGGFNKPPTSLNTGKKFKLTDSKLVIRDFINALNIQKGQKVGNPDYGTTLWSFVFEPNTFDVQNQLQNEIKRVASLDSRLIVNSVKAFTQDLGILVEVELAVSPFNQAELISVFFNSETGKAVLQ